MRKSFISGLSLICLSSVLSISAYAASVTSKSINTPTVTPFTKDQMDYLKKEYDKKGPDVDFYGLIQAKENLLDSQRGNTPDFTGQHLRLGLKVQGSVVNAQAEFEFLDGNSPIIRQAQLNYNFYNTNFGSIASATTISFGGVRIGGALSTAPDVANVPSQFSREDGVYVLEKLTTNSKNELSVGFGLFNNMFGNSPDAHLYTGWGGNQGYLTSHSRWGADPFSAANKLAYVGNISGLYNFDDHRSLTSNIYFGYQKDAPTDNGAITLNDGTPVNVYQTHDVTHLEASALFNNTKFFGDKGVLSVDGVSAWYEQENYGFGTVTNPSRVLNPQPDASMISYPNQAAAVATLYGVGAAGDSSPYFSKIFRKGDRLTYAAAITEVDNNLQKINPNTNLSSNSVYSFDQYKLYQLSTSFGYAISSFETALNLEYSNSDADLFMNGDGGTQNSEYQAYITVGYVF